MENLNQTVLAKLCCLLSFLHHACDDLENIANEISDNHIKLTIRELALETNQYEHELDSSLKTLSISDKVLYDSASGELLKNFHSGNFGSSDSEKTESLCRNEILFEKAYRELLNEYFPYEGLKKMLIYQLNGIKCSFMKIKLLNTVLWNSSWSSN